MEMGTSLLKTFIQGKNCLNLKEKSMMEEMFILVLQKHKTFC